MHSGEEGVGSPPAGAGRSVPTCSFLPTERAPIACLPAVCRARYASPTPARVVHTRLCEVKAVQVERSPGGGTLVLALTRMVDLLIPRGRQAPPVSCTLEGWITTLGRMKQNG